MCLFAENATGIKEIDEARVKLILVPRGIGKTGLITQGRTLQRILATDGYSVGLSNENADNASAFLSAIKQEFEQNEFLRALFPDRVPDDFGNTVWRSDRIVVKRTRPNPVSPSVLAFGVGSTVAGVHLNEIIADDIISQNAAENAYRGLFTEIEATNRWISRLQPLLKNPKTDPLLFIGTRWWEGDTYEYIQKFFGHDMPVKEYNWYLTLPDGERQRIVLRKIGEIAIFKRAAIEDGAAIFPERYNLEQLEMMAQEDPVFYAGQYLLNPTAKGATKFAEDDLRFYEIEGGQIRYRDQTGEICYQPISELVTWVSVDPAFSKKNSAARTAIPVVGTNGKDFFLLEDFARRGVGEEEIASVTLDFLQQYNCTKIFVETIVAQIVIANAIRRVAKDRGIANPPIEEIASHGDTRKQWRIYALEPYFRRGRFYIHRSHQNFFQEFVGFPRTALRDVLDAISFQKDEWERAVGFGSPRGDFEQGHRNAIQRIRNSIGRGGGY